NVPRTLPATFLGVCAAINACDIGMKPAKIPITNLRKNNSQTDVAKPTRSKDIPSPRADLIRTLFLPYLSPIRPHTGDNKNAASNVTPNVSPDQVCTYELEKLPKVLMCKERNGRITVILPAIKKLANHMIAKFRLMLIF